MKLIDQVCSLELSKKLKEIGVKQESLFHWQKYFPPSKGCSYVDDEWKLSMYKGSINQCQIISAFTVAELGEMFTDWSESCKRGGKDWYCIVREKKSDLNHYSFDNLEVNARAKMLIFLIENNLLKVENL